MSRLKTASNYYAIPGLVLGTGNYNLAKITNIPGTLYHAKQLLSKHYQVPIGIFVQTNREQYLVYIRQLYSYWLKHTFGTQVSLKMIAKQLDRDHTTVMYGISVFTNNIETDMKLPNSLVSVHTHTVEDYMATNTMLRKSIII